MQEQTKSFVDSRLTRETQQINPIEKKRRSTDTLFIFVFLLITIAWLVIAISALFAQERVDINTHYDARTLLNLKEMINAPVDKFSGGLVAGYLILLFLSTAISLVCIILSEKNTKFIVYLGMGICLFVTINYLFQCIRYNKDDYNLNRETSTIAMMFVNITGFAWYIVTTIFMIPSVACFLKIEQNVLQDITKNMSRVIFRSPIVIIFAGLITILKCLVFLFTVNSVIFDLLSNLSIYHAILDTVILILGGLCVINLLHNFAFMVISEYSVNYYWKNGGIGVFAQCVSQILRNHMGTVMLSSTLCIPHICAIFQALMHKPLWKNTENYGYYFISKVFLVLSMDYNALIYSSIYGSGFIKSSQKTFDTVLRRSTLYLATMGVIDALLIVIMIAISFTVGILFVIVAIASKVDLKNEESREKEFLMIMASLGYSFYVPLLTYMLLINSSSRALLFNKIISFNKEEQYTEGRNF